MNAGEIEKTIRKELYLTRLTAIVTALISGILFTTMMFVVRFYSIEEVRTYLKMLAGFLGVYLVLQWIILGIMSRYVSKLYKKSI